MRNMIALLKLEKNETFVPRVHYESVVYDTLRTLWARKWFIAAILFIAVVLASLALVLIGPRYTGEAMIQLNFTREEPINGAKLQPTASVDAAAVVDSAVRIVRSRATAVAVVARLRLDNDPTFTHQSLSWWAFTSLRSAFGLEQGVPSDRDLAVNQLLRRITVTSDPRSYLISVSIITSDPERAAMLANAVALEYLRGQLLQQATESYAAAAREVAELSSVYGLHHPSYLSGRAKLEDVHGRLNALRADVPNEDVVKHVTGQSFVPADNVMVATGPNILLVLGLTVGAALAAGIWLALLLQPN
jgi:uncharacterized protein involved in exopolysaccharide biosynthesis